MASKTKSVFKCSACYKIHNKWNGRCDSCGKWNSLEEEVIPKSSVKNNSSSGITGSQKLVFADLKEKTPELPRYFSKISEFDRVCGGGLVPGSAILISGDPGIGKSTILMQVVAKLSNNYPCVYISGEESLNQLKGRAIRLEVDHDNLKIATVSSLNDIISSLNTLETKPQILIIDSIQTMYLEEINSIAGSVSQVRACANELTHFCKQNEITLIMIGHVTREGQIAGPKVLEHMVDCVLYFEGEKNNNYRILRAVKNRFGATDELGIFEMTNKGLQEVNNPSALFLHDYLDNSTGTAVFAAMEGLRPVLVEVQALIVNTMYASPKRAVVGIDSNRVSMITAVLESRLKLIFSNKDIYLNLAGGLKITDPALDLAICAALISIYLEIPLPKKSVFLGEISLSGKIRNIFNVEKRLNESMRLGFSKAITPKIPSNQRKLIKKEIFEKLEVIEISSISDIFRIIKSNQN